MKDSHGQSTHVRKRHSLEPALQVVCLGSGGGPNESNVTGFLVRSVCKKWSKGSVLALDAGSHLAGIIRVLENDFPLVSHPQQIGGHIHSTNGSRRPSALVPEDSYDSEQGSLSSRSSSPEASVRILESGPFAGLAFPFQSARANAAHIMRDLISTYLITHPHLDHISAFAINTAAFHNTARPKKLAALTSTVNALKSHIFNDIIWPNLTDEDGGVGLVTFQRLADGGNVAVGEGQGQGYIEVCDGLCVRGMKISHGQCMKPHTAMQITHGEVGWSEPPKRTNSIPYNPSEKTTRSLSISQLSQPGTPKLPPDLGNHQVVVDSTAYFIRDDHSHREILFFGDVEPDSISLFPRTRHVWAEASYKIAVKKLRAVFIECSYDDSQGDAVLFGHLAPRHLFKELEVLADLVKTAKAEEHRRRESKKRKRAAVPESPEVRAAATGIFQPPSHPATHQHQHQHHVSQGQSHGHVQSQHNDDEYFGADKRRRISVISLESQGFASDISEPQSARTDMNVSPMFATPTQERFEHEKAPPLHGLTVICMHVKDTLKDGAAVGDTILRQLQEHEAKLKEVDGVGLGCEFVISTVGESYQF